MARDKEEAVPAGAVEAKFAWAAGEVATYLATAAGDDWSGDSIVRPAEAKDSDCLAAMCALAGFFAAAAGYDANDVREFAQEYERRMVNEMTGG